jgi:superfamily II DNA or RNA helicase
MNWPDSNITPGARVRVKASPDRTGIVGDQLDGRPGRERVLVLFTDGTEDYVLFSSLERIEASSLKPYDIIRQGRYAGVKGLRDSITFYRLSGKLANLIYSLNTTNTQFMAHQFKPVLNFLDSPANGLLIADEVGLGKTIEAGLIWTELRARFHAKRLLVICPAMLREKWQQELINRFGVKADIVDAGELNEKLKGVLTRPYDEFALIASMQGLRPPRNFREGTVNSAGKLARLLEELNIGESVIDLVVIDEAHYLRNEETQTYKLGELIRPVAENMVMLSATPIQMRSKDLYNLLHLLDDDAFPYETSFDEVLESNAPLLEMRTRVLRGTATADWFKEELFLARQHPLLESSLQLQHLEENLPSDEVLRDRNSCARLADQLDRVNPLSKVINRTLKRDVQELRVVREPVACVAEMSGIEQQFYEDVTNAVRAFCAATALPIGFILTIPQRQMSSSMAAACRGWQKRLTNRVTDSVTDIVEESLGTSVEDDTIVAEPSDYGSLLTELIAIAHEVGDFEALKANDTKFGALVKALVDYWNHQPNKKVVLFSFYKETLAYLRECLAEHGIKGLVLHSGMDKSAIIARFESDPTIQILLSSEVASEGVDLQFASVVVNYDLPWNPMKIEQRIGRIDRIGQAADKILIWNFMYADTLDERVYERLLMRLGVFTRALGDMEAILGDRMRELTIDLLTHRLSTAQEAQRIEQTAQAIENVAKQQERLEEEAIQLMAHGDYILNKVKAARDLGRYISGDDLYGYVQDFLHEYYPGSKQIPIDEAAMKYECRLSTQARVDFAEFIQSMRWQGRSRLLTDTPLPLVYENRQGRSDSGIERVSQDHPLIRFVTEAKQASGHMAKVYPISAVSLSRHDVHGIAAGKYVYAIYRWAITGAMTSERLVYAVTRIGGQTIDTDQSELLVNTAAAKGRDWLGAGSDVVGEHTADIFESCREQLESQFSDYCVQTQIENHDRLQLMVNMLTKRKETQVARIYERVRGYMASGIESKIRMVPLEMGRRKKLQERMDERIAELKLRDKVDVNQKFVAGGVIEVN